MPRTRRTRAVHCRCRKCRKRCTLPMKPEEYENPPLCACGGVIRYDQHHDNRPWRDPAKLCRCDGVWWSIKNGPHRKGGWLCNYNPNYWAVRGETEESPCQSD